MKANLLVIISACLATQVLAVNAADTQSPDTGKSQQIKQTTPLGHVERANKLLGMDVMDSADKKLGTVKDFAVDLESGRVAAVILSTGNVLDRRLVAVPPESFKTAAGNRTLQLGLTQEQLKSAPDFDMSKWGESLSQNNLAQTYEHYGTKPSATFNQTEKATGLFGKTAKNLQDEKIGEVDNLIIDLPAGRVVQVVLSTGGFLGMGGELSAVPPAAFHYTPQRDALQLDTTKEALAKAPHFKSNEWPDFSEPSYAANSYKAYGIEPYFTTDADNTGRNIREASGSALTPLDQGNSESELQTTAQIRKAIVDNKGLSMNAHNVKIITSGNRVTLRGPVNSEEEKNSVADIAAKAFPSGTIDNQLEVKQAPGMKPSSD